MNNQKSAFVAIVGRPNVGKSSLLNVFVGEKVAIVTDKPQTTRTRIAGVLTTGNIQLVFIDTPGIHKPKTKLSEYMVKQVRESVADVDVAVLVTEPTGEIRDTELALLERFAQRGLPAILAVNKIDTLQHKELMLEKIQKFAGLYNFDTVVPISALSRDGVDILLDKLCGYAVPGPHYFDSDAFTDQPERVLVAEMVREKLLMAMREEIPHGSAVMVEEMKERPDKPFMDISVVIFCEKESHKGMIIGKKGAMLKKIASESREEIEAFLDIPINLQCWVKVKEDWRNRDGIIKTLGFQ